MGTKYKRCENKSFRQQSLNVRIRKGVRGMRPEGDIENRLENIKIQGERNANFKCRYER